MSKARKFEPRIPLTVRGGIRAQSRRGGFARHWWGRHWLELLESFHLGARLGRGRGYAYAGQVIALSISAGRVTAQVQGGADRAYDGILACDPLDDAAHAHLVSSFRKRPLLLSRLLVRDLPHEVETLFAEAGTSLFPPDRYALKTHCTCRDWANPCKHLAAVFFLLIEAFDQDPLLLLSFRGIELDELLDSPTSDLGAKKQKSPVENTSSTEKSLNETDFWGHNVQLEEPDFGPSPIETAPDAPLTRRLGSLPFWRGEERFLDTIGQASRRAVSVGWRAWAGERMIASRTTTIVQGPPLHRHAQRPRMET